jgi:hypothetical protein
MVPIEVKFIPESRENRRTFTRGSAFYQKFRIMDYITLHDVGQYIEDNPRKNVDWYHWYIAVDPSTENPPANRKAWHYTVGPDKIIQHLRNDEVALHSGQGLFAGVLNGNSNSIGIEMLKSRDPAIQKRIEDNTARLCAKLIKERQVRKAYPGVLKQHWDWPRSNGYRKNCPALLRSRSGGWDGFVNNVGSLLVDSPPLPAKPPTSGNYIVIVGSYTDTRNADAQVAALQSKGWSAMVQPTQTTQGLRYRVVAGSFERLQMAESLVGSLKRYGFVANVVDAAPVAPTPAQPPQTDVWYRVFAGSWRNRHYADEAVKKLKQAGYDAFIEVK